jgi:hypothetical protein
MSTASGVARHVAPSLRPLAWTRIGFGLVVAIRTTPLIALFDDSFGGESVPLLGWPRAGELRTPAIGFGVSDHTIQFLCVLRTLAILAFFIGYRARVAGVVAGVTGYIVLLQNAFSFTFTQHLMFVGLFLLAWTDCDAELAVRPSPPRSPRTSLWLVWLFTTSIYAWAAIAKLRRDWLDGRTLGLFLNDGRLRGPLAPLFVGTAERRAFSGPMIALMEISLGPLLLWKKTRWWAFVLACSFHVGIEAVARPDVFGWLMVALLMSFVPLAPHSSEQVAASNGHTNSP